jgi:hypothetical protein
MKKQCITLAIIAALCGFAANAYAEDSDGETPIEEYDLAKQIAHLTPEAKEYITYLEDIDRRYPDTGDIDIQQFVADEGEKIAIRYCGALGFDSACAVETKDGVESFVAVDAEAYEHSSQGKSNWWE